MKSNKGFTLVEIIVVIGLLAIFSVSIGISLNRNMKKNQENRIKEFNQKITGAANLYASNNQSILENLYEDKGYVLITTEDLIKGGLIQDNLVNPETNEKISGNESIRITLDSTGTIKIDFPVENTRGDYLQIRTLKIEYGSSINNICYEGINTENLRYIKANGDVINNYLKPNENITCNSESVRSTVLGTYEIKYDYTLVDGSHKQAVRNVIVEDTTIPECGEQDEVPKIDENNKWINTSRQIKIGCIDNYKCEQEVYYKTLYDAKVGKIVIKDVANNTKECEVNVYSDISGPKDIIIRKEPDIEWVSEVTLTGEAIDEASGIKYYTFSTNPNLTDISSIGTSIAVTNEKISKNTLINTEENYTYYFYAQDALGHLSRSNGISVKIDKGAPSKPSMSYVYGTWSAYNGAWTTNTVYAVPAAGKDDVSKRSPWGSTDTGSGVKEYQICKENCNNENNWIKYEYDNNNSMYYFSTPGEHSRYFRACDYAGNCSEATEVKAKIDSCTDAVDECTAWAWSGCSSSNEQCGSGKGTKYQYQRCNKKSIYSNQSCGNIYYNYRNQNTACDVDCCSWTEEYYCTSWSYGSCSATCDGGWQQQSRTCYYRSGYSNSSASCGSSVEYGDSRQCNTQACYYNTTTTTTQSSCASKSGYMNQCLCYHGCNDGSYGCDIINNSWRTVCSACQSAGISAAACSVSTGCSGVDPHDVYGAYPGSELCTGLYN